MRFASRSPTIDDASDPSVTDDEVRVMVKDFAEGWGLEDRIMPSATHERAMEGLRRLAANPALSFERWASLAEEWGTSFLNQSPEHGVLFYRQWLANPAFDFWLLSGEVQQHRALLSPGLAHLAYANPKVGDIEGAIYRLSTHQHGVLCDLFERVTPHIEDDHSRDYHTRLLETIRQKPRDHYAWEEILHATRSFFFPMVYPPVDRVSFSLLWMHEASRVVPWHNPPPVDLAQIPRLFELLRLLSPDPLW